jgi:hypothetical protein
MRADRAAAGLSGAAILVVIALSPGGVAVMEPVLLIVAGLVVLGTFAPALPLLHRLRVVGAPQVSVVVSFEPLSEGGSEDLRVSHVGGHAAEPRVLRVGFVNDGPRRVRSALVNVLVDARVEITASDHLGDTTFTHGRAMPLTNIDGRPMRFWADKDVTLAVGATLLNYRLSFPDVLGLGNEFPVRVQYDADDLHGGERVDEHKVYVIDLKDRQ